MCLRRHSKNNGDPAERALEEATKRVREVKARGPEVDELVGELKRIRAKNHFAEQLHNIMYRNGGIYHT